VLGPVREIQEEFGGGGQIRVFRIKQNAAADPCPTGCARLQGMEHVPTLTGVVLDEFFALRGLAQPSMPSRVMNIWASFRNF
jgi:hypothetical protein